MSSLICRRMLRVRFSDSRDEGSHDVQYPPQSRFWIGEFSHGYPLDDSGTSVVPYFFRSIVLRFSPFSLTPRHSPFGTISLSIIIRTSSSLYRDAPSALEEASPLKQYGTEWLLGTLGRWTLSPMVPWTKQPSFRILSGD